MSIESIRARANKLILSDERLRVLQVWSGSYRDNRTRGYSVNEVEAMADECIHSRQDIPALLKVAEAARHEANQACIGCDHPVMPCSDQCEDCAVKVLHAALAELEAME